MRQRGQAPVQRTNHPPTGSEASGPLTRGTPRGGLYGRILKMRYVDRFAPCAGVLVAGVPTLVCIPRAIPCGGHFRRML